MLDPDETRQADLRSRPGPWRTGTPRPVGRPLERDIACEVAIVGGGITGALISEHLARQGRDVVLIDREREGFGSTAASTAMLQWEIDQPLTRLAGLYGEAAAADAYRRSAMAAQGLCGLIAERRLPCAFQPRETVYLAAGEAGYDELRHEHHLRERAGLPGTLLDHPTLLAAFGFDREGAIVSPGSAEADPLSLCHGLLALAAGDGARLVRDEAVAFDSTARSAHIGLAGGATIEARHVVLATGYVMPDLVHCPLHRIAASWAIATVPQEPQRFWPGPHLVWEASEDYSYFRSTADGRVVFGGEDEELEDPDERAARDAEKGEALRARMRALLPHVDDRVELVWSGAFGQTRDGLPLIGRVPGHPRLLAAYGYGGNGITFSFLASRLIASLIAGREEPWFEGFALDREGPP